MRASAWLGVAIKIYFPRVSLTISEKRNWLSGLHKSEIILQARATCLLNHTQNCSSAAHRLFVARAAGLSCTFSISCRSYTYIKSWDFIRNEQLGCCVDGIVRLKLRLAAAERIELCPIDRSYNFYSYTLDQVDARLWWMLSACCVAYFIQLAATFQQISFQLMRRFSFISQADSSKSSD